MKKRRFSFVVLLCFIFVTILSMLSACSSSEIPIPTVEENTYIYDTDNVIDDDVEKSLNKLLVELEEKTGAEFVVVSVPSLLGNSIEHYSNELFNTLGIGKKEEDNGILLLFSRSDKRVRLEIGRGLEGCLNDSKCGKILDDYFVPYRNEDEYSNATKLTVEAVLNVLAKEYNITISDLNTDLDASENELGNLILLIIVLVVVLIVIFCIFDDSSYSGYHYYGGSSFRGGSSFGGGFSGGGGASR